MTGLPANLDAALDTCMEAAVTPALWGDALDQLSSALGFVGCSLNTKGGASRLVLPATSNYRDMLVEYVSGGWRTQDLRTVRGWPLVTAGAVTIVEDQISTQEERQRLPFYTEFLQRHDMPIFAALGFKIDDQLWSLSGARSARQGMPSPANRALLERTQPHLKRTIRFAAKVAHNARQGAMASLEILHQAAICLDRRGRVTQMTQSAEALMGDGVSVRAGRLMLDDGRAEYALHHLIQSALDAATPYSATTPTISARRDGQRPLLAEVIPAREALCDPLGFTGALVLLHDLDQPRVSETQLLRQAFSLSQREAQVAALIGAGADVEAIATQLDLRRSSIGQLVKAAMAKMGVSTRAELAALVARLPRTKAQ